MNKMGIILAIVTVLGIGVISFYFNVLATKKAEEFLLREPSFSRKYYKEEFKAPAPAPPSKSKKEDTGSYTLASPPLTATPSVGSPEVKTTYVADNLETKKFYVKAVFSSLILIASLFIVIKGGNPESIKWAFGSVGTILGYWLK